MARPRVFISSTFYDLRSIREELDRFIRNCGFEPIRHERGHIPYGKEEKLEEYAYREIDTSDILLCVIGGKYGTASTESPYSITQKELKTALTQGKQVYIFVDRAVHQEHRYYIANKDISAVRYTAVDNTKIYEFLEEIYALPRGNPIFPFDTSSEITAVLLEQWAGLFQRLLVEHAVRSQTSVMEELQRSLQTVGQLVEFLTKEKGKGDLAVQEILFSNHPFFDALRRETRNSYRIYFKNLAELNEWALAARSLEPVVEAEWDEPEMREWMRIYDRANKKELHVLKVKKDLFTADGDLKPITPAQWSDAWVKYERSELTKPKPKQNKFADMEDDIPF